VVYKLVKYERLGEQKVWYELAPMDSIRYNKALPDYGDLMSVEKFKEYCRDGCFIDYDGHGYPVKDNKMTYDIIIKPSKLKDIPNDTTHIMWFNR
jgi:hypothetical protein